MVAISSALNILRLPRLRNFSARIMVPLLLNRARLNQNVRLTSSCDELKWKEYTEYITISEMKKIDSELMKNSISMRAGVIWNRGGGAGTAAGGGATAAAGAVATAVPPPDGAGIEGSMSAPAADSRRSYRQ